ncbi:MAG: histidinol-phosphatase [Eggerthellaceae bacterium]
MELASQHNHTNMTNHGHGSIEEVVASAHERGMTNLAITEHYPLTLKVDPRDFVSMHKDKLDEYLARIAQQRSLYPDMELLVGCELDWLGKDEDRTFTQADYDQFDIILGSVHFLDLWPFDDPAQSYFWQEAGADYIWRRYFEVWCEAVVSQVPFTVMAHPDLVKKYGHYPSFDPMPLYKQAVEACASAGRMIEVNTSGITYACKEPFPSQALLREFCRAGVPCTIGSDAHHPSDVDRAIQEGYRWMYEAGYRWVTLVVPGGDRREIPLA